MPFAGYKDFADCVTRNQDKRDPEAYCAVIMNKTEHPAYKRNDADMAAKAKTVRQHIMFAKRHRTG